MQRLDGQVVVSATDLVRFAACRHLTHLDRLAALGVIEAPTLENPLLRLFADEGIRHEQRYLAQLRDQGNTVAVIEAENQSAAALTTAEEQTLTAMRAGVDVVYQATFYAPPWRGQADFLLKVPRRSGLGAWSYEVADTKLHKEPTRSDWLQLSCYAGQLRRLQGTSGEMLHVVVGDGRVISAPVDDHAERYSKLAAELLAFVERGEDSDPDPNDYCTKCRWRQQCTARWEADDHLSLAGVGRRERPKLIAGGVKTVADLAGLPAGSEIEGLQVDVLRRLRSDAKLLLHERRTGVAHFRLRYPREGKGLAALPHQTPDDVFFDLEGVPYTPSGQREYLFGAAFRTSDGFGYQSWWAHNPEQEQRAFEDAVDFLVGRVAANPDMHVYHYNHYEPNALRRLARTHGTRTAETEALCDGVLVDLLPITRDSIRTSALSAGLKVVEKFYRSDRQAAVADAASSMVEYTAWLEDGHEDRLAKIEAYNRDDCESLAGLLDWLEGIACHVQTTTPSALQNAPDADGADELMTIPDPIERAVAALRLVRAVGPDGAAGALLRRTIVALDFDQTVSPQELAEMCGVASAQIEQWLLRGKMELGIPIPVRP